MERTEFSNPLIEDTNKFLEELKQEINKVEPLSYTNRMSIEYVQKPGTYCDPQARTMASDMFFVAAIYSSEGIMRDKAFKWAESMNELNYSLMRMWDDERGERPLLSYDYDRSREMIKEFAEFLNHFKDEEKRKYIKSMMDKWAEKLVCMNLWVVSIEQTRNIKDCINQSEIRCFDSEGNMIEGISEEDEQAVKALCAIRKIMIRILVKLPVMSHMIDELINRINSITLFCKAILEGKTSDLEYLLKCYEAAEEFAEE